MGIGKQVRFAAWGVAIVANLSGTLCYSGRVENDEPNLTPPEKQKKNRSGMLQEKDLPIVGPEITGTGQAKLPPKRPAILCYWPVFSA